MGMAASQARYIELAARKTNVEYEGQQINQQRTALANESAGLFNKMLQLQVPTAPNYNQYVKMIYSFNDGTNEYTIASIARKTGDPEYNSTINYYTTTAEYTGMYKERSDLELHQIGDVWYYGTKKLEAYDEKEDEAAVKQVYLDTVESKEDPTIKDSYVGLNYKNGETDKIFKYKSGGVTYYLSLDNTSNPIQNNYATTIDKKVWQTADAYLSKDDSGNYSSITLENYSNTFDLSVFQETDDRAYNQAMNDYVYQKAVYDKNIADINAKTEIIQQEDRTLELKLKQLDTEHNALQTEMDAVKKVCDKNVEDTFKTFG